MADSLTFGDTDLSQWLTGIRVDRPLAAEVELDTIDVPGRDGCVLNGSRRRPLTIEVEATVAAVTAAEVAEARHAISAALASEGTRRLVLPDDTGVYYEAVLTGATPLDRGYMRPRVQLTFSVPDACGWGVEERSARVTHGQNNVSVGGNAPTWPALALTTTSTWFSMTNNTNGDRYNVQSLSSGKALTIDNREEVTTFDGAEVWPLMGYDYVTLVPGRNNILLQYANGTMTWHDRWV